jgi:hypothetical protein
VKALIKEKKEKENVLTNLELIHLQDVSLLQFKKLRGKTTEGEREKLMEDKKEYQRTLQDPQAQLERAQEQRKSLDPIGIKKRLEDYEHMLQYSTLMKMKNTMKDFKAESEEWREVVEEYFTKQLEKNLAQHKVDERILKYKLEAYQKNIFKFHLW